MAVFIALNLLSIATDARAYSIKDHDSSSAPLIVYHRVGEERTPSTNIKTEQFKAQIDKLLEDEFTILPLKEVVQTIQSLKPLPNKTIALTFDGGYSSAYINAIPYLESKNIPYTIFFSPGLANRNTPLHLNWNDLKKIKKLGISNFRYSYIVLFQAL